MSDQENRKLQHTDEQNPGSQQKAGNQANHPVQQKQENPSGQPKSPQWNKRNTIKKRKSRLRCHGGSIAIEPSFRQTSK